MTATHATKRGRESDDETAGGNDGSSATTSPQMHKVTSPTQSASNASLSAASTFRNVSACNRCRMRKNRCDQRLPACASCEKARIKCVGYDPITKKEIPRSYVYYLESRVSYLESLLSANGVFFSPPNDFTLSTSTADRQGTVSDSTSQMNPDLHEHNAHSEGQDDRDKLNKLVSNIGMVSVQGTSDPRYLGSTSGISFARVVFAAVKSSVSGAASERSSVKGSKPLPTSTGSTTMRDSFFGLQTKPTIKQAPFPDKELGSKLVELYFEHANPQIPILHRGEFMAMFEKIYLAKERALSPRESYMLNIVFAIGSAIIVGASHDTAEDGSGSDVEASAPLSPPKQKRRKISSYQHQPEEYHASAILHLESFLGSSVPADRPDGFGGGLDELQAVLLLAGFALLRPVAPGLWYIIGVAVRLAIDLGLHYEDGIDVNGTNADQAWMGKPADGTPQATESGTTTGPQPLMIEPREVGRRQWVRDLRRRLWWCVYSFDRLVSTCVGRPFGITDTVITTEFPSLLDDKYITTAGFQSPPNDIDKPSYKYVAHHYFRLRLLQSEILQVLQHRQAQQVRNTTGTNMSNEYMHTNLPSPFLEGFASFRDWRHDIDRRLSEWKETAPAQSDTGVQFQPMFLELNYWQAIIMLYRQSLTVPATLANELGSTNEDVQSPTMVCQEDRDDEEIVFLKVAEAGQQVLKIYRKLHRLYLVNYTYLATHHLFMAGISFLYAIWHSTAVRSLLTVDDFDFTVLAATSVLGDLVVQCPPAEACRDAFERMSRATIQMVLSTTGFGAQVFNGTNKGGQHSRSSGPDVQASPSANFASSSNVANDFMSLPGQSNMRTPYPRFDMDLSDLFTDDKAAFRQFNRPSRNVPFAQQQRSQHQQAGHRNQQSSLGSQRPIGMKQEDAFDPANDVPMTSPSAASVESGSLPQSFPQIPNQMAYNAFAPNVQSTYPDAGTFSDLDWLDTFPVGSGNATSNPNFASAANGSLGVNSNTLGELDLGFGMGWDAGVNNHDWADGGGFDLFDGFFFGNGSGGSNSGL